jgi:hypothetical protein
MVIVAFRFISKVILTFRDGVVNDHPDKGKTASKNQQVNLMGRIEFQEFSDRNITRIFIAKNIKEAQGIEKLLTQKNIDYALSVEPFLPPSLLQSERMGAAFYVETTQSDICRQIIIDQGLGAGIVYD